jgi:Alkylmercury lyase
MLTSAVRELVYRRLAETGRAPGCADLARELNRQPEDVATALRQLEAEHALVLAPATTTVWMAHPFSNVPTDYRVSAVDGAWWANCAWDSLGVASQFWANVAYM